jgi:hypothetical protein
VLLTLGTPTCPFICPPFLRSFFYFSHFPFPPIVSQSHSNRSTINNHTYSQSHRSTNIYLQSQILHQAHQESQEYIKNHKNWCKNHKSTCWHPLPPPLAEQLASAAPRGWFATWPHGAARAASFQHGHALALGRATLAAHNLAPQSSPCLRLPTWPRTRVVSGTALPPSYAPSSSWEESKMLDVRREREREMCVSGERGRK